MGFFCSSCCRVDLLSLLSDSKDDNRNTGNTATTPRASKYVQSLQSVVHTVASSVAAVKNNLCQNASLLLDRGGTVTTDPSLKTACDL